MSTCRWPLPLLGSLVASAILLVATACSPLELAQRLRNGGSPAQVPQELSVLWEVWQILGQDYGGKEPLDQRKLSKGAIMGMVAVLGNNGRSDLTPEDYDLDAPELGAVWQAWGAISRDLEANDNTVIAQQLQEAAIRGMVAATGNPYMVYMPPHQYELEKKGFESSFEGIGAYVSMLNNQLTVVAPIPNAPAEKAGVLPGDVILEVDGESVAGLTIAQATLKIRGPRGTSVMLLVLHPGQNAPVTITIVREVVEQPSVEWQPIADDIAYLQISHFLDKTDEELEQAMREVMSQGFRGLVMDVRRNPGGLLDTAVAVASQFLKDGLVLYQVDGHGNRTEWKVREGGLATDIPMVVLVDRGSASGSELLVGALQDHQRATIIGTRSFGKGSINELRRLKDGSGLYLTTALWYTPSGRLVEGDGVIPNVSVRMDIRLPLGSPFDRQLSAALDHLKAKVGAPTR